MLRVLIKRIFQQAKQGLDTRVIVIAGLTNRHFTQVIAQ
ncbi:MAG: hypothetical protein RL468_1282, partial [Pseudomonadota bacterium]